MNKGIKMVSIAGYLPDNVVTNDDLSKIMKTSDEWIQSHTGIKQRYYAFNENTSDLATEVGKKLLERANLKPEDIDLLIVSTISPDAITPSTAAIVEKKLNLKSAFAFDISAACAGFIYALSTAHKFLVSGLYCRAMVISAETNSKMMDFKDRTSAVFFGDGAAGMIVEATDDEKENIYLSEKLVTVGNEEVIHSGRIAPLKEISSDNYPSMDAFYQNGREVYNFVTTDIVKHIKEFLETNKVNSKDLSYVVTHQANLRLIEIISKEIEVPLNRVATDVKECGNTSSVGIPLALARKFEDENITGKVLLTGFGAGLAYGSILLEFGE